MSTGLAERVVGLADGLDALDARQLGEVLADAERIARAAAALQAAVVAVADRTEAYRDDGHLSVRGWVAATVAGPRRRATELARLAAVCAAHPVVFEHLGTGRLSLAAAGELGRLHANPRVTGELPAVIEAFVTVAERALWDQFIAQVRDWERLTDAHGAHDEQVHAHARRSAAIAQLGDTTYLDARLGTADGATVSEVLERFAQAEFDAEWADLVATHGEDACPGLLGRTEAQRRADALVAIFRRAAGIEPTARDPQPLVNIVVSQPLYEEQLAAMAASRAADFGGIAKEHAWCATIDGTPLDPADVVAASLVGHVRRVVIDNDGRVIDLGRRRRIFSGAAREAVLVQAALDHTGGRCLWPGCGRLRTQVDHVTEWHQHGTTDAANGTLLCGRHNRFKTRGYRIWRDADGIWHTIRPDGTDVQAA
ncbi:MAG: HNH endonuclease [Desertimonas sp.]